MNIYLVTNDVNDKAYIGLTTAPLEHRWQQHLDTSAKRRTALHHAIKKYGKEKFHIMSVWSGVVLPEGLNRLEKYYIKCFGTKAPMGYNLTDGGDGVVNPSEESKEKNRMAHLGKPTWNKGLVGAQEAWNKGLVGAQEAWNKGISVPGGMKEAREASRLKGVWNKGLKGVQVAWNKGAGFSEEERRERHKEANVRYRAKQTETK